MKFSAPLTQEVFHKLIDAALATRKTGENWVFSLTSEATQFIRFNHAKVRQIGNVLDADLQIKLILEGPAGEMRTSELSLTLGGDFEACRGAILEGMKELRSQTPGLPADPYATAPRGRESSESTKKCELLSPEHAVRILTEPLRGLDLAGIYASGTMIRASATSTGQKHWFETDSFALDYSLYTPQQKALKNLFAGQDWSSETYRKTLAEDEKLLPILERPPRSIPRGAYRVYFAPQAVAELISMFTYGTLSESSIRQQDSPLRLMRNGEKQFSPFFSLTEDFSGGEVPRFNDEGELSPMILPLIAHGKLVNTLISSRTATEYKIAANGADSSEALRSPKVKGGSLRRADVLKALGTGLYLSNLHYLNWSDQFTGRVTGMTRYACFWVEGGEIVAPIRDLRFDDSLFHIFGSELENLTQETSFIPDTGTYVHRQLGGMTVPGALVKRFEFTL